MKSDPPIQAAPTVLILTDGKIGDLAQCRGIAQQLTTPNSVTERVVKPGWLYALPLPGIRVQKDQRRGSAQSVFEPPAPDVILASGRRTLPYLREFRQHRGSAFKPLIIYLKDPRLGRGLTDFIWAPTHDGLSGTNMISTHTSPHGFDETTLTRAHAGAQQRFAPFPGPFTGVILGGNSGSVKWNRKSAGDFAEIVREAARNGSVLVTASRRTPPVLMNAVKTALLENLSENSAWIWDGEGENPYLQILSHSDILLVTGDSHNMVSESLATGAPVYVYRPPRLQSKLHSFLNEMEKLRAIRNARPGHPLEPFSGVKMDATAEIVAAIRTRYAAGT